MSKFLLFSKDSCGPCMLVDKYMKSIKDERTSLLEKVDLEDVGSHLRQKQQQLLKSME